MAVSTQGTDIPVGTHFFRQSYLYAFAPQATIINHVRTQALRDEVERLPSILDSWRSLQARVKELAKAEAGFPDTIAADPLPNEYKGTLDSFAADELFKKTFQQLPISFALVEIDRLVAAQRAVNLNYVERLIERYPEHPTLERLLNI